MKVAKLIEELQKMPPDTEIMHVDSDGAAHIGFVGYPFDIYADLKGLAVICTDSGEDLIHASPAPEPTDD